MRLVTFAATMRTTIRNKTKQTLTVQTALIRTDQQSVAALPRVVGERVRVTQAASADRHCRVVVVLEEVRLLLLELLRTFKADSLAQEQRFRQMERL